MTLRAPQSTLPGTSSSLGPGPCRESPTSLLGGPAGKTDATSGGSRAGLHPEMRTLKFSSLLISTTCNWIEGAGFKNLSCRNDYNFLKIENESD